MFAGVKLRFEKYLLLGLIKFAFLSLLLWKEIHEGNDGAILCYISNRFIKQKETRGSFDFLVKKRE